MRITALAGGTGAAKLLRGLAACVPARDLTIIGNTGDDTEVWGLAVSPDLDTIIYALAGRLDVARGWGLADETFRCLAAMAELGADTWFNLGDRDLATHVFRTHAKGTGRTLSSVTAELARRLGVEARILPMSDEPVRTQVRTRDGWLTFQEYFVREKALVEPLDIVYAGVEAAHPAPGVLEAIRDADLLVICPSNPVTSVGPILRVTPLADALATARAPAVAVSPIIGQAAVSGPAGALLAARGLPVSPLGVAAAYEPWLDVLLIDPRDAALAPALDRAGVRAVVADILMTDRAREVALARRVLEAA
jgi:LPPG:FO 2-phospho-L-lactate transferase